MPLFRATSFKRLGSSGHQWSNVYTIDALDAFNALEVITNIQVIERAVHYDTVAFYRVHVVQKTDKNNNRTSNTSAIGDLVSTGLGGQLPLFNTVRVIFGGAAGRPEVKYLRIPGQEANLTLGLWDGEFISFINDNYAVPLAGEPQFVGPSGEPHTTTSVSNVVQNRQLGWHRRHRPGFKRGWVPV